MNISTQQKQTHRHRTDLWLPGMGRGAGRRGMDWDFGVGRCRLLHLEWINNKALLYCTGNYIQYPVLNHNGKEYKKRMYLCIKLSHFAVQQRSAQHCKSTILQLKKKNLCVGQINHVLWVKVSPWASSSRPWVRCPHRCCQCLMPMTCHQGECCLPTQCDQN